MIGTNTSFNTTITGTTAGDRIKFVNNGTTVITLTTAQQAVVSAAANVTAAINALDTYLTSNTTAIAGIWGGDTYVIEQAVGSGPITAATDGVIKLTGSHTLSTTVTGNVFTLAS